MPTYQKINTLAEFNTAYRRLRERHEILCIKPAVSIYGLGFKIIDEGGSRFKRLVGGDECRIGLAELQGCLGESEIFHDMLLMEYLPGEEYSVDSLADANGLLYAIARQKSLQPGYGQVIVDNPEIESVVQQLTSHYHLRGLFNVQFKLGRDGLKLLEINTRMSGGLPMVCLTGINLPYLALLSATGQLDKKKIAPQKHGMRVAMLEMPVVISQN